MERRGSGKKRNFSEREVGILTSEVEKNKEVLFGSVKSGIKRARKNAVWQRVTDAVNSVNVEERTMAEVKKKWSDLKLATKRRVADIRRSVKQTGGGQLDSSLVLTGTEDKIASIIGSDSIACIIGGGDTEEITSQLEQNEPGTSSIAGWSPLQSSPSESDADPDPDLEPPNPAADRERVSSIPPPSSSLIIAEVLERQKEICSLLTSLVGTVETISNTLKEINETLKKTE